MKAEGLKCFFPMAGGEAGHAGGAIQDGGRDGREVRRGAQDGEEEAPERGERPSDELGGG